jgi:hypothetical protein
VVSLTDFQLTASPEFHCLLELTKSELVQCFMLMMIVLQGSSIKSSTAAANYATSGYSQVFEQQIPRIPAKRLGNPEEVNITKCPKFSR